MFRPVQTIKEKTGVFVALTGTSNAGKTWSALELATGLASNGRIAVLDTEGGRTVHLKHAFDFDVDIMGAPFSPGEFAKAAIEAENAGYACLLIDSFSQEWVGEGGVLSMQQQEVERGMKGVATWAKPKSAHKAMVNSLLQRRIPIVFSIRGEKGVKPAENPREQPTPYYKSLTDKSLPFEMTIAFRLDPARKGYIDLSDAGAYKLEGAHAEIFKDGERLSRAMGEQLRNWWLGLETPSGSDIVDHFLSEGNEAAARGSDALKAFWGRLTPAEKKLAGGAESLTRWKNIAAESDKQIAAEDVSA